MSHDEEASGRTSVEEISAPSAAWKQRPAWLRKIIFRVQDRLGRLSGDRIPRPGARGLLRAQWEDDAADNRAATPGPDSHVEMVGIWAFEAFTPSNIGRVLSAMERKGWAQTWSGRSDRDLVGWIQARRRAGELGTHSVHIQRARPRQRLAMGQEADLPDFADFAVGRIVAVTPSISGLALFFVARPEAARAIETALRTPVRSRVRSEGRAMEVVDPEVARREAVERLRLGWRAEIAGFFKAHAPGVFSEGRSEDHPTCELLVGDDFPFFAPRGRLRPGTHLPKSWGWLRPRPCTTPKTSPEHLWSSGRCAGRIWKRTVS